MTKVVFAPKAGFTVIPPVKAMINIGAGLDVPVGTYIKGKRGENILNGGLGSLTGVVGIGNNFKTTIALYMMFVAMARILNSSANEYDTEINVHEWHVRELLLAIKEFFNEDIIDSGRFEITDKTIQFGGAWWDKLKGFLQEKIKNNKQLEVFTPFINREKTDFLKIIIPTFTLVDSLSEFITEDVVKMQDANLLGDSGANTVQMRQGLQKNRFLQEIPGLAGGAYNYTLFTAHIGEQISMDPYSPPAKKLQYLKGMKIKGVPDKFTFLMNNCWWAHNATPLVHKETKTPLYPRNKEDRQTGDTDLNVVSLLQLRSKSGKAGAYVELVVSQNEGVLPSLTEFHYIKTSENFGLGGNNINYYLELLPDVNLSRTTVREKIDNDEKLQRALNITAELCQLFEYHRSRYEDLLCTPKELYDDLKALGYDWNVLLDTRGFWVLESDDRFKPFLSTMDLLEMRKGLYKPYWMT